VEERAHDVVRVVCGEALASSARSAAPTTSARRACRYWQYPVVPASTRYGVVSRAGTRTRRSSTGLDPGAFVRR
jgi:hypothetical protein